MKAHDEPCSHHKNVTDYHRSGACGTPYCGSWTEYHCRDCGWFFTDCRCGCNNGESKVPEQVESRNAKRRTLAYIEAHKAVQP